MYNLLVMFWNEWSHILFNVIVSRPLPKTVRNTVLQMSCSQIVLMGKWDGNELTVNLGQTVFLWKWQVEGCKGINSAEKRPWTLFSGA